jgi:cell division protease FtsH
MSQRLGPLTFGKNDNAVFLGRDIAQDRGYSEEIAFEIDKEIRRIVDECHARARNILEEHRNKLDQLAEALLEREVLDKNEVELLFEGKLPPFENGNAGSPKTGGQPKKVVEGAEPEKGLPGIGSPAPTPA